MLDSYKIKIVCALSNMRRVSLKNLILKQDTIKSIDYYTGVSLKKCYDKVTSVYTQ